MKEQNDPAKLSEEEVTAQASTAEETTEKLPETDGADEQTEKLPEAEEPTEEPEGDPAFVVSKRQADGTWKRQPVTAAAEPTEEPNEEPEEEEEPEENISLPDWKELLGGATFRKGRVVVGVVVAAVLVVFAGLSIYTYQYPNIFRGVKLTSTYSLSGMTQEEAANYIESECQDELLDQDITVSGDGKEFTLHIADAAEQVDGEATAEAAYQIGREGGYFQRLGDVIGALLGQKSVTASVVVNEEALDEFVQSVHDEVQYDPIQPSFTVDKSDAVLTIDTGTPGLDFDESVTEQALAQQMSVLDCTPYELETEAVAQDKPDAEQIAEDASCEAENAKVDTETGETVASVHGVSVTADAIAEVVGDAAEQTYTVPITVTKPEITQKELDEVLFRDTLAQVTTYYTSDSGRTNNVRLTAEACDGIILNPGDEFSYNDIVGERTPERGYQKATIFVNGESVEDYGGGACQSSSTIYMAVLRADLEVTERRNHQFQISYTPISQDATVAWGSQDFKFVNDTDYPIKVTMDMGGGALTCTIYGTKTDDKTVSLSATSSVSGDYRYATLYKTVTVNGESETYVENTSAYLLSEE
jgi:vancomycin resistance protein YoaR